MLYSPDAPELTPLVVPLIIMVAPGISSPVFDFTVPLTVWACKLKPDNEANNKVHQLTKRNFFRVIELYNLICFIIGKYESFNN